MSIFENLAKKERLNKETGLFETINEGLFKEKKPSAYKELMKQYYDNHPEEKPSTKLKKGLKKAGNAYIEMSKRFAENNPEFNLFNPANQNPINPDGKKKSSNDPVNPFMNNPFYNPFLLVNERDKVKKNKSKK